jgi:hypothetical protein
MRKRFAALFVAGVFGLLPVAAAAPAQAAAPSCAVTWGSLPKSAPGSSVDELSGLRVGRHDCYDRLVIDASGKLTGYDVRYVDQVFADGSGFLVPLRGGARMQIVVRAPWTSGPTFLPNGELANVSGFSTFRQLAWANSFEGQSNFGLGVRARLPFRVFILDGPGAGSRIVIDVAHHW